MSKKFVSGFSIVEAIIAMVVISIAMLYGTSFFTYGNMGINKARQSSYALELAKNQMELIKSATSYDVLQSMSLMSGSGGPVSKYGTQYNYSYNIVETTQASVSSFDNYFIVFVTVTWDTSHRTTLRSIFPKIKD